MNKIVFIIIIALVSSCSNKSTTEQGSLPLNIFCDLETIIDGKYSNGSHGFNDGQTQTDKAARSGQFSAGVNAENPYALSIHINNVKKGHFVSVSVWRKSKQNKGVLALSSDSNEVIKLISFPIKKEGDWELLEFNFIAERDFSFLKTYVHNPTDELIFFDDISIKHFSTKPLPEIDKNALQIKISDENFQVLKQYRNEALKNGVIGAEQKEYVKGSILFNNQDIPVEVRLKGDWTDHLEGNKWSLRIKVEGDNAIMGFKTFSIQSPHTRAYLREWTMHKIYELEDVLTTRYKFASVALNNENLGVFAVEEHFDKELLEAKNRNEAPILKFNEEGFWENIRISKPLNKWIVSAYYEASEIMPFKKKRITNNPELFANFQEGEKLLLRYKQRDSSLSEIFDLDALAKYYALADLGNISHGLRWHNMRFYYNPDSKQLEQIAFDCFTEKLNEDKRIAILGFDKSKASVTAEDYLTYYVFNHPQFKKLYIDYLIMYSNPDFIQKVYSSVSKELDSLEKWMQIEFPNYIEDRSFFVENAANISASLEEYQTSSISFSCAPTIPTDLSGTDIYFPSVGLHATSIETQKSKNKNLKIINYHSEKISIIGYGKCKKAACLKAFDEVITLEGFSEKAETNQVTVSKKSKYLFFKVENLKDSILTKRISDWKTI